MQSWKDTHFTHTHTTGGSLICNYESDLFTLNLIVAKMYPEWCESFCFRQQVRCMRLPIVTVTLSKRNVKRTEITKHSVTLARMMKTLNLTDSTDASRVLVLVCVFVCASPGSAVCCLSRWLWSPKTPNWDRRLSLECRYWYILQSCDSNNSSSNWVLSVFFLVVLLTLKNL